VLNDELHEIDPKDLPSSESEADEPERSQESWKRPQKSPPRKITTPLHSLPRIPFGGHMMYQSASVDLLNTCNMDTILQTLYYLFKTNETVESFFRHHQAANTKNSASLITIFRQIDSSNWPVVRHVSITQLLRNIPPVVKGKMDLYGSEERLLDTFAHFLPVTEHIDCPNKKFNVEAERTILPIMDLVITDPSNLEKFMPSKLTVKKMYEMQM